MGIDHTFDEYTEQYSKRQLDDTRNFAKSGRLAGLASLEIGTNRGRFLKALAERQPEQFHLGCELRFKWTKLAQRDLENAHIDNAFVICADANFVLPVVFDEEQINQVFVLFPDPWWKKRHAKRRLIQDDFLDLLATKMTAGGRIIIRSDVGPLADEMRETLTFHKRFKPVDPDDYGRNPFPRSTRERSVIEKGIPINLVYFERV